MNQKKQKRIRKTEVGENPPKPHRKKEINYGKIPADIWGWVDAGLYKPRSYDVCVFVLQDKRKKVGWWTGSSWFGREVKWDDQVIKWKLKHLMKEDSWRL